MDGWMVLLHLREGPWDVKFIMPGCAHLADVHMPPIVHDLSGQASYLRGHVASPPHARGTSATRHTWVFHLSVLPTRVIFCAAFSSYFYPKLSWGTACMQLMSDPDLTFKGPLFKPLKVRVISMLSHDWCLTWDNNYPTRKHEPTGHRCSPSVALPMAFVSPWCCIWSATEEFCRSLWWHHPPCLSPTCPLLPICYEPSPLPPFPACLTTGMKNIWQFSTTWKSAYLTLCVSLTRHSHQWDIMRL